MNYCEAFFFLYTTYPGLIAFCVETLLAASTIVLFFFLKYFCRSTLQEILVHSLKHSEPHEALTVLYTLSFKQTPPQNFISAEDSANANSGSNFKDKNVQLNLMKDHFIFAHGDDGGVVIKLANDNAEEGLEGAEFLRNIQGNTLKDSEVRAVCVVELLSLLKKDDIAGHFFIHLMQELKNIISDFSEDMDLEGE